MKNDKKIILKGSKKIISLALASVMITSGLLGCSKETKSLDEKQIGFNISNDDFKRSNGLYYYVLNKEGYHYYRNYNVDEFSYGKSFAKVDETKEYGTNFLNTMASSFYEKELKIVWPEDYVKAPYNIFNFDINLKIENVTAIIETPYVIVYSSITAKKDIESKNPKLKKIKKGDKISSVALYHDDKLLAFKQTGMGEDCNNVVKSKVGDIDVAISTVYELGLLNKTKDATYLDLYKYQKKLNNIPFKSTV